MILEQLDNFVDRIREISPTRHIGYVTATDGGRIHVSGLGQYAKLGDRVVLDLGQGEEIPGEVLQIDGRTVTVMPDGSLAGVSLGDEVWLDGPTRIFPCDAWLGRVITPNGEALDGAPLKTGLKGVDLKRKPPNATVRKPMGKRVQTGANALNTLLPLVQGQRLGLFAGSGVGKSSLLATLSRNVDCDVVVLALIGERGRELRHFVEQVLGEAGMQKCVVVAATSDRSPLERRRCAWTAMSVAEYFRDQGKSVLFLADSITRFAEAHREVASAGGELPVLRGHPPSTAQMIMELCERAGPGAEGQGDITAVFSVLVAGSDMEEPIADILRGVLDGHIVLSREIAERGRYPAIDLLQSVSRSLPHAATEDENRIISDVRSVMSLYARNEMMIRSGLYSHGSDGAIDRAIKVWNEIDAFLGTCDGSSHQDGFDRLRMIFRRAGPA